MATASRMGILLSHHRSSELDRCLRLGRGATGVYLCARCTGLYPALAAVLWLRLAYAELGTTWDGAVMFGLGAIGMLAWGVDRLRFAELGQAARVVAGAVLGASLGWMLAIHFREPFARPVVGQITMIVALWAAAEILRRSRYIDLTRARRVEEACDGRDGRPDGATER